MKKISTILFAASCLTISLTIIPLSNVNAKTLKKDKSESLMVEKTSAKKDSKKSHVKSKKSDAQSDSLEQPKETRIYNIEEKLTPSSSLHESKVGTSGHYVGFDLFRSSLKFSETYTRDSFTGFKTNPKYSDVGYGAGLSYKYAFNFDGAFLAPRNIF